MQSAANREKAVSKSRIGYIGVGLMGHGAAKNILLKGYPLTIMGHRHRGPVDDLLRQGAKEAKTPAEVAKKEAFFNFAIQDPTIQSSRGQCYKDASGSVFHTYSTHERGIDMMNNGLQLS